MFGRTYVQGADERHECVLGKQLRKIFGFVVNPRRKEEIEHLARNLPLGRHPMDAFAEDHCEDSFQGITGGSRDRLSLSTRSMTGPTGSESVKA